MSTFSLDWKYDRDNADTNTKSRYGNYLYMNDAAFREIWYDDPSVESAAIAWRIANGPVMSPGLVRSHARVSGATVYRSDWNGELAADITLVSPRPQQLDAVRPAGGGYFRDLHLNAWDQYDGISGEDLVRSAYLLTEVRVLWEFPPGTVPTIEKVPTSSDALFRHAVACLEHLIPVLNRQIDPIIRSMEGK